MLRGQTNPIRYRGYYYDGETGFYLTGTRYYDPEICRFINADSYIQTPNGDMTSTNMFAYCGNNPVNRYDPNGEAFLTATICGIAVWVTQGTVLCVPNTTRGLLDYSVYGNNQKIEYT